MRPVILKQVIVWLLASVLALPPLLIFLEDVYAAVRYRSVGIPLLALFEVDFSVSFVPWVCISLIVIAMIGVLLLAWPAVNRIWLIVLLTIAATWFVVWLLWSVTSIIPVEDTQAFTVRVLFGEIAGLLLARLIARPKKHSISA